MMKKVLILAYYFPPLGMGGVQRILKFVKYLPEFGWKPVVVTVKNIKYHSYDYSLLEEITKETKVYRTGSADPARILFLLEKLFPFKKTPVIGSSEIKTKFFHWFFFPDTKSDWAWFAFARAWLLSFKEKFDVIFSTSPPVTSHLIAWGLKKILKKPWVADFRDVWLGTTGEYYPTRLHKKLKSILEKKIFTSADLLITVNPHIQSFYQKKYPNSPIICLPNGYDRADFPESLPSENKEFRIVYSGTLSSFLNPEIFIEAFKILCQQNPEFKRLAKFYHIGKVLGARIEKLLKDPDLVNNFTLLGYKNHKESIKYLTSANLLLLLSTVGEGSDFMTTSKIYEYLATGIPIMALVPPAGAAADLIRKFEAGTVINSFDLEGAQKALANYFQKFLSKNLKPKIPQQEIRNYERRNLTLSLAQNFGSLQKYEP